MNIHPTKVMPVSGVLQELNKSARTQQTYVRVIKSMLSRFSRVRLRATP